MWAEAQNPEIQAGCLVLSKVNPRKLRCSQITQDAGEASLTRRSAGSGNPGGFWWTLRDQSSRSAVELWEKCVGWESTDLGGSYNTDSEKNTVVYLTPLTTWFAPLFCLLVLCFSFLRIHFCWAVIFPPSYPRSCVVSSNYSVDQWLVNFSCKWPESTNTLGFAGHTVSVATIQLCYSEKGSHGQCIMNRCGCIPIKLHLQTLKFELKKIFRYQ